eukprot:350735-Chlamydomonas_euryale.AAC.7
MRVIAACQTQVAHLPQVIRVWVLFEQERKGVMHPVKLGRVGEDEVTLVAGGQRRPRRRWRGALLLQLPGLEHLQVLIR